MAASEALPEPLSAPEASSARIVWALAWPAVALNSLQVVNTLLDRTFIGHLPESAMTAHAASMNPVFFAVSLAMSLGAGITAIVARAYGAGETGELRMAARQGLSVAWIGGLLLSAALVLGAPWLATWLLPSQAVEAKRAMVDYTVAFALGMPAVFIIQSLAAALRGVGDTKSPMVISGFQIGLHVVLNRLMIFPPHRYGSFPVPGLGLGLTGAAASFTASAWVAALVYVVYTARTPLGALYRLGLPDWAWAMRILRIATPAGVMSTLRVASMTMLTLTLAMLPNAETAIAAISVGFGIESIMFMPAFGLSVAAGALVGQSLGMRRPDRAERLAWTAAHHAALVTLALVTPIFLFAPQIVGALVVDKPALVTQAASLLRWLCATELLFAYAMVIIGAMQGAGDTVRPLWISIISLWGLRVPLNVILALPTGAVLLAGLPALPLGFGLGSTGVWMALSATQALQGVLSIVLFRQGRWKSQTV